MGCIGSTPAATTSLETPVQADAKDPEPAAAKPVEKAAEKPPAEKPQPQIFAIMRNGHEVIRGVHKDLKVLIVEAGDYDGALELWEKHKKWMYMHMIMEEGNGSEGSPTGLFKLLNDNFDGCADEAGLGDLHASIQKKEDALIAAFEAKDMEQIKTTFLDYDEANEAHLKKEEDVMMPKVMQMKKSGMNVKKLMIEEVLAVVVDMEDFEFFVKFANEILEKHAEGQPRVRVFDHALWAVATEEQWTVWDAWIKEVLKPETYEQVQGAIKG